MNQNKYLLLIIIGVSNGMIPLLIGSTLFVWLKELGLNTASIGLYGLANLPFALSFAMSAFLEYSASWKYFSYKWVLVFSLLCSASCVYYLPAVVTHPHQLFITCLTLSLASSVARIISTALQKTLFPENELVVAMNILTISYKCGILLAGSLALYLSQRFSWPILYQYFALAILSFSLIICTFPRHNFNLASTKLALPSLQNRLLAPFTNLFQIPQFGLILALMFCFRAPDNLITNYFDLFYLHFGLSKTDVAFGYKLFGMVLASVGGIVCIRLIKRHSYVYNLNLALILHILSYALIYWFTLVSAPRWVFYLCVSCEEFSRGMTMIIFWAYQTHICKRQHVLIQLAILTGLDSLGFSLLSSIGGSIIYHLGYSSFILVVIASSIPAFLILNRLKHNHIT